MVATQSNFKPSDICALTCVFNPLQYESRIRNFRLFHDAIAEALPVYIIECVFGDVDFALSHLPNHIGVRSESVLWQKERLINHALCHHVSHYAKVAWLDADILFTNPDWVRQTSEMLETYRVVQLFEEAYRLPQGATKYDGRGDRWPSFGATFAEDPSCFDAGKFTPHGHTGFGWAARRDVLMDHGLYDACLSGSADHVMVHAMCGRTESRCIDVNLGRSSPLRTHFEQWAQRMYAAVDARVAAVPGSILHLWHGEIAERKYNLRCQELLELGFDPASDIVVDDRGCWTWKSDRPDLHAWGERYFSSRKEDG